MTDLGVGAWQRDALLVEHGQSGVPIVHLHGGQMVVVQEPARIVTILGSCVAVCLFDPGTGVAGMNHFLLPQARRGSSANRGRFGDVAIPRLIGALLHLGAQRHELHAKVFGGACGMCRGTWSGEQVGARNVQTALALLAAQGIPVIAQDVGGPAGRRVAFHTQDGSVWVKLL